MIGVTRGVTRGVTEGVTGVLLGVLPGLLFEFFLGVLLLTLLQVCEKFVLVFVVFSSM